MIFEHSWTIAKKGKAGRFAIPFFFWWGPSEFGPYKTFRVQILLLLLEWTWHDKNMAVKLNRPQRIKPMDWTKMERPE